MADEPRLDNVTAKHFIQESIEADMAEGRTGGLVKTRFPPEPNGYLHIGHAKAITVDFGMAAMYGGTCNLRFDDTNPTKEDVEYVDSIQEDIRWLGYQWDGIYYASDYFGRLYELAELLIKNGKAYVDESSEDVIRDCRGDYYRKGRSTAFRDRPFEESLSRFKEMREGIHGEGSMVLRAKIDLESQNMNMRDPIMYRIRKANHHRTGSDWCIYPMYDFAHPLSDAIEGITHSLCTLEFEAHRPLYDWFIRECGVFESRQIEFARLNVTYTMMSKRRLLQLVQDGVVDGWDDPRLPTISGLRRRGVTPRAIRRFCERIGLAKNDSIVDVALFEHTIREDLNDTSARYMAVQNPVRLVLDNFPEGEEIAIEAPVHPDDESLGMRTVYLSRELLIEADDFREVPPPKWHRMAPGMEVRLRYGCLVTVTGVDKDESGEITCIHATWDPESKGGQAPDGRRVKGTIHWVSSARAVNAEVRLYDRLFTVENPSDVPEGGSFKDFLNPESLKIISNVKIESAMVNLEPGTRVQFERLGYYCVDSKDSRPGAMVFNRTVTLRDSWAKIERQGGEGEQAKPEMKEVKAPTVKVVVAPQMAEISIDDFAKVDLRVAIVLEAEFVEGADKLLRLLVNIGEAEPRQIFAGIRKAYGDPATLVGKRVMVVANLKPRQMRFGLSQGMVLAGGDPADVLGVATFDREVAPGSKVS